MTRVSDPRERRRAAGHAQLRYVCCADAGIQRKKRGRGFIYPALKTAFLAGALPAPEHSRRRGLNADECDLLAVLEHLTSTRAAA